MKVEYGIPTDKEAIQLRLGIEHGLFREQGLDLSLRVVFGGPEVAALYSAGELKVGELGSPPATTALSKGANFKIVGSSVRRRALQYFVAAPSVRDWEDLRGKTVAALSVGSCSYWFARMVLERHGLDPDLDVSLVGLGRRYPDVVELFKSGELQAAVLSEPNVAIGEYHEAFSILKALNEPDFCPTMQWSVIVANNDVIASDPTLVRAVLTGCRASYHYAAENPEEMEHFGADYFGIDVATMRRAQKREEPDIHNDCEVDMPGLDLAIDLQRRLGAFQAQLRSAEITDLRHLRHAFGPAA